MVAPAFGNKKQIGHLARPPPSIEAFKLCESLRPLSTPKPHQWQGKNLRVLHLAIAVNAPQRAISVRYVKLHACGRALMDLCIQSVQ